MLRAEILGDEDAIAAATSWFGTDARVGSVLRIDDEESDVAVLELSFDGSDAEQADLLRAMVEAGHRVVGFSRAASDLEEIFLRVTGDHDGKPYA